MTCFTPFFFCFSLGSVLFRSADIITKEAMPLVSTRIDIKKSDHDIPWFFTISPYLTLIYCYFFIMHTQCADTEYYIQTNTRRYSLVARPMSESFRFMQPLDTYNTPETLSASEDMD